MNNETEMIKGKVVWYSSQKSYGFVEDDTGSQFFVHESAIRDANMQTLVKDQRVQFSIVQDRVNGKTKVGELRLDDEART